MSKIQDIIERREMQADRGHMPSEYQEHHDLLSALDTLTDQLERIADALELRNLHEGITYAEPILSKGTKGEGGK